MAGLKAVGSTVSLVGTILSRPIASCSSIWICKVGAAWDIDKPQSFARSTYAPSAVITTTRVPADMCGGTAVFTPLESSAGL